MDAIFSAISALALALIRLLDAMDKARADAFRSRIASDPVGVCIDKLGGKPVNPNAPPGVVKSATRRP